MDESLRKFDDVAAAAKAEGVAVRGYVSCVVGCPIQVRAGRRRKPATRLASRLVSLGRTCPQLRARARLARQPGPPWRHAASRQLSSGESHQGAPSRTHAPAQAPAHCHRPSPHAQPHLRAMQGEVAPQAAAHVAVALSEMGCYEVSMGDTIGVGNPASGERASPHVSMKAVIETRGATVARRGHREGDSALLRMFLETHITCLQPHLHALLATWLRAWGRVAHGMKASCCSAAPCCLLLGPHPVGPPSLRSGRDVPRLHGCRPACRAAGGPHA